MTFTCTQASRVPARASFCAHAHHGADGRTVVTLRRHMRACTGGGGGGADIGLIELDLALTLLYEVSEILGADTRTESGVALHVLPSPPPPQHTYPLVQHMLVRALERASLAWLMSTFGSRRCRLAVMVFKAPVVAEYPHRQIALTWMDLAVRYKVPHCKACPPRVPNTKHTRTRVPVAAKRHGCTLALTCACPVALLLGARRSSWTGASTRTAACCKPSSQAF